MRRRSKGACGQAGALRWSGRLRRLPGDAHPHGLASNSLRALRALRSNSDAEFDDDAHCARGHAGCASQRPTGAPQPARTPLCPRLRWFAKVEHHGGGERQGAPGGGRCVGRREAQARGRRAQRALLSDSPQLFERSACRARSEFCSAASGRASQRSQCSRPLQPAPPPGAACRVAQQRPLTIDSNETIAGQSAAHPITEVTSTARPHP